MDNFDSNVNAAGFQSQMSSHPSSSTESSADTSSSLLMSLLNTNKNFSLKVNDANSSQNEKRQLKLEIDALIESYLSKNGKLLVDFSDSSSSVADSNNTTTSSSLNEELFVQNLFEQLLRTRHKERFKRIYNDVDTNSLQRNLFIIISKIAYELFEVNYYDSSERLLEFAINEIDTGSLLLKMSTLSTLSACYWKQSKFSESIRCMNLEFNLVSHLNDLQNKYRILGNIANAYQLLNNNDEAKNYFKLQLSISLKMKNRVLTIHSLNSLGNLHMKCKEGEKALECYNKSLSLIQMLVSVAEPSQQLNKSEQLKKQLLIKQYNLVGECYLKLNQPQKSRSYFLAQLEAANQLIDEADEEKLINICKSKLSLALIETKLNHYSESIIIYEELLNKYFSRYKFKNFELIEIYFKINLNLLNACLKYNKIQKAISYAQHLLEFSLSEQNKQKFKLLAKHSDDMNKSVDISAHLKYFKYLKYIELCACGKLATCFSKSSNHVDATKLYERELKIAKNLNNTIFITRAYSHLAQVNFLRKDYNKCISYYKEILNLIKTNVSATAESNTHNTERRLLQMTFYTLSNLGLCMELLNRLSDAYLLFIEQYEISKRLNNLKYNANALLNIINLYFKYEKSFNIQNSFADECTNVDAVLFHSKLRNKSNSDKTNDRKEPEQHQDNIIIDNLNLKMYLYNLLDIYQELNDLNGELFISQCLAYYYHKNNFMELAIKFYIHSIEMCKILTNRLTKPNSQEQYNGTEKDSIEKFMLNKKINFYSNSNTFEKSLFNLSLCYRYIRRYEDAYKYQLEYLELVKKKHFKYSEFISLGILADLLLEMSANYDECIRIQITRLRVIQNNLRHQSNNKEERKEEADYYEMNEDDQERYNNELEYFTMKRCKLIANCLSSIAKCYFLFKDYQQVYKFKLMEFKLRIQDEQQMINKLEYGNTGSSSLARKQLNKEKFKILLDLGNLLLFKLQNYNQALYYYEYAYKICKLNLSSDLILTSLALGNIGICKLKLGEYELAINYFKQQIQILNEKLKHVSPVDDQEYLILKKLNIKQLLIHKEYILVYLDIGRSYSKLSKCYELLNSNSSTLNLFEDEALNYLIDYLKICELLFNKYCTSNDGDKQAELVKPNIDLESERGNMSHLITDVNEQINNDFDLSLYKLAKFYINKLKRQPNQEEIILKFAISLQEKRLNIHLKSSKISEGNQISFKILNKIVEISFIIANLYFRLGDFENSYTYLFNVMNMMKNEDTSRIQKINFVVYLQAMVLFFKISLNISVKSQIKPDFEEILSYALQAHAHLSGLNDEKYFQLKVDVADSILQIYIKLGQIKLSVQFLSQAISNLTNLKVSDSNIHLKNMFKLNFKLALAQLNYDSSSDSSNSSTYDSTEAREQNATSALNSLFIAENCLNNEDFTLAKPVYELRLANLYFYKGISYKELKNFNVSLEMFANALDLYENHDKNTEFYQDVQDDELLEGTESRNKELDVRIDTVYEFIEDLLIKTDKLKEALLVTERHRSKFQSNLTRLIDLSQFDQIESLLIENNPLAVIYFHLLKFNSTINCWLLEPGLGITKFHQISFKSLSSLLLLAPTEDEEKPMNFLKHLIQLPNDTDKDLLLKQAYNILIKPFENNLFNWLHKNDLKNSDIHDSTMRRVDEIKFKNKIFIIYDEDLFTVPFHMLRFEINFDNKLQNFQLHEVFDCNCVYSLKNVFASQQIGLNFKCIPNEIEFQKLVESSVDKKNETNKKIFYKLLILNIKNDTSDFHELNRKINQLFSSSATEAVILNMQSNNENGKIVSDSLLSDLEELESDDEKIKNVSDIYLNMVKMCAEKSIEKIPYCFMFGKNINLYTPINAAQEENSEIENEYISNTICEIMQLNVKTIDNSLLNLLLYLLGTYLKKIDQSSNIITTSENIEKRLNLHDENENNSLILFKRLLKQLGFTFMDPLTKNILRFPSPILQSRLEKIHKCLLFMCSISAKIFVELCKFTTKMGMDFLRLLSDDYEELTNSVAITVTIEQYNLYKDFLNEINENIQLIRNLIRVEINIKLFSNINFLLILLFDKNQNSSLSKFIEEFTFEDKVVLTNISMPPVSERFKLSSNSFKTTRKPIDDDEQSSQYSTLSSILGFQSKNTVRDANLDFETNTVRSNFDKLPKDLREINKELSQTDQYTSKMHKMIEINVDTESEIATYDRYLSQLLENDLKSSNQILDLASSEATLSTATASIKLENNSNHDDIQVESEILDLEKTFDDESKWTCLLQYEEEERINKLITTTTTRTITEDVLYFEKIKDDANSRLCLNDSIGDDLDDVIDHNNPISLSNHHPSTVNHVKDMPMRSEKTTKLKLNSDGIYSNLINYTSNSNKNNNLNTSSSKHSSSSSSSLNSFSINVSAIPINKNINEDENNSDISGDLVIIQPQSSVSSSSVSEANDSGFYSSNNNKLIFCTNEIFA